MSQALFKREPGRRNGRIRARLRGDFKELAEDFEFDETFGYAGLTAYQARRKKQEDDPLDEMEDRPKTSAEMFRRTRKTSTSSSTSEQPGDSTGDAPSTPKKENQGSDTDDVSDVDSINSGTLHHCQ